MLGMVGEDYAIRRIRGQRTENRGQKGKGVRQVELRIARQRRDNRVSPAVGRVVIRWIPKKAVTNEHVTRDELEEPRLTASGTGFGTGFGTGSMRRYQTSFNPGMPFIA